MKHRYTWNQLDEMLSMIGGASGLVILARDVTRFLPGSGAMSEWLIELLSRKIGERRPFVVEFRSEEDSFSLEVIADEAP